MHVRRCADTAFFQPSQAGTGAGYDLSVTTFSPDGRVFQAVSALLPLTVAVVFRLMATSGGVCWEGRGEQRDNACDLLQGQELVEVVSQPQEYFLDVSSRDDAKFLCHASAKSQDGVVFAAEKFLSGAQSCHQ